MRLLICNAGSTSLKFDVYEMPQERILAECRMERIGNPNGGTVKYHRGEDRSFEKKEVFLNYEDGIRYFLNLCYDAESGIFQKKEKPDAVAFKTVLSKGFPGVFFADEEVLQGMREMLSVAPAHNRHYLAAIETFEKVLPDVKRVCVFETAFHQTISEEMAVWSLPYDWYERYGVRKYGYHGASHAYVASCLDSLLGPTYRAVSCHLGGSCSLCAIRDGKSYDTSFGLSLQCGLPQSNRCGDFDPFVLRYVHETSGKSYEDLFGELEHASGLAGLSGISGDVRDLLEAKEQGSSRAALALSVFCRELVRYIGGYAAEMGGIDAIAFTGGIGENCEYVRSYVMEKLAFMGIKPGDSAAPHKISCLTEADSSVKVYVIPAKEELIVARKAYELIK